jgi:ABC-type lipoprotein release transport system permease subunit
MIAILSALNGIETLVSELFSTFDAEVTVIPARGKVFEVDEKLLNAIHSVEDVNLISGVLEEDVIVRFDGQPSVASIKGVDTLFRAVTDVDQVMRSGEFILERDGLPCAIVGYGIQSELAIPYHPEDFSIITLSAPIRGKKLARYKDKALNTLPILVSGVFSVNAEMDVKYVIVPLDYARELLSYDKEVSHLDVSLRDGSDPEEVKEILLGVLGPEYDVETRYDKNEIIHKTNRSEKWATFLILTFILLIAGFNIIASLTMLIIEKRKDIFILRSFGLTKASIRKIFSYQGVLINVVGAAIGSIFGLGLCIAQQQLGLIKLEGSIVPYYPVEIRFFDVAAILLTVLTIGVLFSTTMVRYLIRRFT